MITDEQFAPQRINFIVHGEPVTKARARVAMRGNKVHAYTPEPTKRAEAAMRAHFLQQVGRLAPSSRHAFGVDATFYMASGIRRDVDNMLKIVLDGLNKVAWGDDYQVTEVIGRKIACTKDEARTEVTVYPVGVLIDRVATCEHCGGAYARPPSHAAKKYCSAECRRAGLAAKRTRACTHCGEPFTRHGDASQQSHCSIKCFQLSRHVTVTCARCGKEFSKPRSANRSGNAYCSPECKAGYWNEHRKGASKGTCADCGGPTSKAAYLRCRDCSFAAGGRHAPPPNPTDLTNVTNYEEQP